MSPHPTPPVWRARGDVVVAHEFLLVPIDTYGPSLTVLELFSRLQKRLASNRPSDPPRMTNTAREATALLGGKNSYVELNVSDTPNELIFWLKPGLFWIIAERYYTR